MKVVINFKDKINKKSMDAHWFLLLSSTVPTKTFLEPITPPLTHLHSHLQLSNQQTLLSSPSLSDPSMKRPVEDLPDQKLKKIKHHDDDVDLEIRKENESGFNILDENLLFEVLKHVDAKTLATAACVSKQWHNTAQDERLWELICTRHWSNLGCGYQQLRSVVLALGGFRRLHSLYLLQLSKRPSASNWSPLSLIGPKPPARWGRDEVHLSLSLLSIRFYEAMNSSNRT